MEDDEVAHALPFEVGLAVEFVDRRLVGRAVGEQPHEPDRGRLDEMDAGRFQRLEEAGGKAERDAIPVPHLAPLAGREAEPVGVGELLAVEVGEQQLLGGIVVDMLARIDVAVADAVLERDAPLPARLARGRPRVGRERRSVRAHGTAIARSHGSQWLQSS